MLRAPASDRGFAGPAGREPGTGPEWRCACRLPREPMVPVRTVVLLDVRRGTSSRRTVRASALALLVAQVLADHLDATVPADHLALVADLLDAGLDLHRVIPPPPLTRGRPGA
ncbi:hypothetical protein CBZ_04120 [Cellulomonas biazotea]|uniref:Uncharacterized protein n=1 Tax=Cellulomonas biazotea TaxID=1709 RepID=A0A402DML7_9CELL|nr:hypothetical protein CBZ_04120 [Cellulomonas biazotea]